MSRLTQSCLPVLLGLMLWVAAAVPAQAQFNNCPPLTGGVGGGVVWLDLTLDQCTNAEPPFTSDAITIEFRASDSTYVAAYFSASPPNAQSFGTVSFAGTPLTEGAFSPRVTCPSGCDLSGTYGGSAFSATVSGTSVGPSGPVDTTAPTVSIAPLVLAGGTYTAQITLSEAATDFVAGDLTLTNATASLSGSGTSYTATLTPIADGAVSLSVAAAVFTDAAGNDNTASNTVTATFDATAPTVSIAPLVLAGGTYTAQITLSEAATDFVAGDLTLTNATASLSGSGSSYTATLTPVADGAVSLSVAAAVFTDAAGNDNTASNTVTATFDATAPTVTLSGAPDTSAAGDTFSVTVAFSETVTGFVASDISVVNATVIGLSGSGSAYVAMVKTSGAGDARISVPAGIATDPAGNGNLASNVLDITDLTVERTQEVIASYMQTRANQLVRNQPSLMPFLSNTGQNVFNFAATQGSGNFDFATSSDYPVWVQANGSWTTDGDSKSEYVFGALGSHRAITENLLVGAMLQFDHLSEDTGVASVSGTGWMVGPYFVARSASQPLYFEGRLLYGKTSNTISPFGTYEDSFDTARMLAQLRVAGELSFGTTTLNPFLDASYTTDDQHSYMDSLGNTIPEQGIALGQIEIGTDFSMMLPISSGELELLGGVSGIWSHTSGNGFASTVTPDYEGGRARVELGMNRTMSAGHRFTATTYYDGIGADGFESYGVSLGFETQF